MYFERNPRWLHTRLMKCMPVRLNLNPRSLAAIPSLVTWRSSLMAT